MLSIPVFAEFGKVKYVRDIHSAQYKKNICGSGYILKKIRVGK